MKSKMPPPPVRKPGWSSRIVSKIRQSSIVRWTVAFVGLLLWIVTQSLVLPAIRDQVPGVDEPVVENSDSSDPSKAKFRFTNRSRIFSMDDVQIWLTPLGPGSNNTAFTGKHGISFGIQLPAPISIAPKRSVEAIVGEYLASPQWPQGSFVARGGLARDATITWRVTYQWYGFKRQSEFRYTLSAKGNELDWKIAPERQ